MSVASILSSLSNYNAPSVPSRVQQFRQEFKQLGQDLQTGNLTAAQADFATLQQLGPQSTSTSTATSSSLSSNPIAQAFNQLSQDLQSGNLSGAQQDFSNLKQDFQNQAAQGHHHHHHHAPASDANSIEQTLSQLGQALQSGDLTSAQKAYSTLQQDFQQFAHRAGSATQSSASPVSLNA